MTCPESSGGRKMFSASHRYQTLQQLHRGTNFIDALHNDGRLTLTLSYHQKNILRNHSFFWTIGNEYSSRRNYMVDIYSTVQYWVAISETKEVSAGDFSYSQLCVAKERRIIQDVLCSTSCWVQHGFSTADYKNVGSFSSHFESSVGLPSLELGAKLHKWMGRIFLPACPVSRLISQPIGLSCL